ncbi:hypothetical protein K1719_045268 [Acacia pycnantha]|nr:hypothetical protein K1719_045268 [Acacia pycnantha]
MIGFQRKKPERKYDENSSASDLPAKEDPLDWWIEFSKRMSGYSPQSMKKHGVWSRGYAPNYLLLNYLHLSPSKEMDNFESIFKISRKTFSTYVHW